MSSERQTAQRLRNLREINAKRKKKLKCKYGHPLDGIRSSGGRYCKTCRGDSRVSWVTRRLIQLQRNPNDKDHGTPKAYNYGCRCLRCKVANSKHQKGKRENSRN